MSIELGVGREVRCEYNDRCTDLGNRCVDCANNELRSYYRPIREEGCWIYPYYPWSDTSGTRDYPQSWKVTYTTNNNIGFAGSYYTTIK